METEDRVTELESEIQATKEELKRILLDIRAFLMEAQNPLRPFERKKVSVNNDSGKEVAQDGDREES
ncbi:MAG: hypothetical protein KKF26_07415 [Chloroflexi bacterium]|nr:hypothetical protein [Chloroflexota bacterium]